MDGAFNSALVNGFVRAPRGLGANPLPPEGIVSVDHPRQCKHWMRVITQGQGPYVTIEGVALNYGKIFDYYVTTIGASPYFIFGGYLFKFIYTGYDAKTGKYHKGGKNEILVCVDGLFVENTGHGTHYVSKKSKLGSGAAIGGVMGLPAGVGMGVGEPYNATTNPPYHVPTPDNWDTYTPPGAPKPKIQPLGPGESPVISVPVPPSTSQAHYVGSGAALMAAAAQSTAPGQPPPVYIDGQGYFPPPVPPVAPVAPPAGMSTTTMVVVGLLGIAVLGAVVYFALEPSAPSPA